MQISYNLNGETVYYTCSDGLIKVCGLLNDALEFAQNNVMPLIIDLNQEMPFYEDLIDKKDWPLDKFGEPSITLLHTEGRPFYCKNLHKEYYQHESIPAYDVTYDYLAHSLDVLEQFMNGDTSNINVNNCIPVYELEIIFWHADYLGYDEFVTYVTNMLKETQMHKTDGDWREYMQIPDVHDIEKKNEIARLLGWEYYPEELNEQSIPQINE